MPVINQSNSSGTIEFSIPGHEDDFFPVTVSFICKKSFFDISVSTMYIQLLKFGDYPPVASTLFVIGLRLTEDHCS